MSYLSKFKEVNWLALVFTALDQTTKQVDLSELISLYKDTPKLQTITKIVHAKLSNISFDQLRARSSSNPRLLTASQRQPSPTPSPKLIPNSRKLDKPDDTDSYKSNVEEIMQKFSVFMEDYDNQWEFFEEFNGTEKISLSNFKQILNHFKFKFTPAQIEIAHKLFDENGDGWVSEKELWNVLTKYNPKLSLESNVMGLMDNIMR